MRGREVARPARWLHRSGRSVFFTGCAGTGKSLLLRHILRALPPAATFATGAIRPDKRLPPHLRRRFVRCFDN